MDPVVPNQKSFIDSGGITVRIPQRVLLVLSAITLTTVTLTTITFAGPAGNASAAPPNGAGITLDAPIVATAATPDGGGYWLATADGGIFAYGDAPFYGSAASINPASPIVGLAATPDGGGYWLVAHDGGVFAFGDASFDGSMAGRALNGSIVGIAAEGGGYELVGSDGAVFAFGGAPFDGSAVSQANDQWVIGIAPKADGGGYWLMAFDGSVFTYGSATFFGSLGGARLALVAPAPPVVSDGVTDAERNAWERVAICEEGGNWQADGSEVSGGLGITRANWNAYGGTQFAPEGAEATEDQQIIVAMRISPNPPDQNGCTGSW